MIILEDIHKTLGGRAILQGLSLHVRKGETLVIIGRSGIGKSVTLRHIVGLLHPDSGTVRVSGLEVPTLKGEELVSHRRRIGYLFQDGALLNWMTVGENVALPLLEHNSIPKSELKTRVEEILGMVELKQHWHKLPSEISGGMRKRAGLARALICRPEILLYDEPTSGLDPISSSLINQLIRNLNEGLAVTQVVVTHDMESAYFIADRIALLHEGKIRALGSPEEIQKSTDPAVAQFIHGEIDGPLSQPKPAPAAPPAPPPTVVTAGGPEDQEPQ